jgi:ABC-type Mn2+/Zn2+ transport system permease subunit
VKTLEYLADPDLRELVLWPLLAGLPVVVMCGVLSVMVVVKRLGFVGQGVSHSAFGGVGVAAVLAALGLATGAGLGQFAVIVAFCVAAALGMAAVSDRRATPVDTAIGLFLVVSMAGGALLVQLAPEIARDRGVVLAQQSWESILFGSVMVTSRFDTLAAWIVAGAVLAAAWFVRRPMLFWVFEEETARAFGVRAGVIKALTMIILALAVVVAMRVAGVVLATALLVLPGATALRLSERLARVVAWSVAVGVLGLVGGVVGAIEFNLQPGPAVVLVMAAAFALAVGVGAVRDRAGGHTLSA